MAREENYERNLGMLEDRESGMTYEEIGEKYGVSRQRVGQICGKWNKYRFRVIKKKGCVFVNLRNWMNENSISRAELVRMMGFQASGENLARFRTVLTGNANPRKDYIDGLMQATGMSYEDLFKVG